MGKNLRYGNLVTRPKKLAFWQLPNGSFQRMEGFTDLSYSQNPKEYSRQYVDEDFERTDIVGYAPSISYSFDRYTGNEVLEDIVKITENEYIGDLMKRTIVTVDLSSGSMVSTAKMRDYAVIPDTNGDTTDCLTYSGNFKAKGLLIDCTATSDDDWQTIRVDQKIDYSTSADVFVSGDGVQGEISSKGATHVMGNVIKGTSVTITVNATYKGAIITLYKITNGYPLKLASGIGRLDNPNNLISSNSTYFAVVENGENHTGYTIDLTAVETAVQTASTVSTTSAKSKTTATIKE
ncbi:MAG: hypothetical protein K2J08_03775 [Ruminococcus sp.]|nr:hypothetical protein [Ruminococcus sp.]